MSTRTIMIVQARISSTRLPAKSLLPLSGEPMIFRIIERIKRCKNLHEIVIAIPDSESDDVLERVISRTDVSIFRGSENDLLDRYYNAAKLYKAELVLRLPADNPVSCPEEIDKVVNFHIENNYEGFSSNLAEIENSGYPDGIGAEVFSFQALEKAWKQNLRGNPSREHVHLNFYNYETQEKASSFEGSVKTPKCPSEISRPDLILDINHLSQYLWFEKMYNNLYNDNNKFCINEIIDWSSKNKVLK